MLENLEPVTVPVQMQPSGNVAGTQTAEPVVKVRGPHARKGWKRPPLPAGFDRAEFIRRVKEHLSTHGPDRPFTELFEVFAAMCRGLDPTREYSRSHFGQAVSGILHRRDFLAVNSHYSLTSQTKEVQS